MAADAANEDLQLKRLRWRARRGTRELDALFSSWLDRYYPRADEAQRRAFAQLLEIQDPDLWGWLTGAARPARADWQAIIDDIHSSGQL